MAASAPPQQVVDFLRELSNFREWLATQGEQAEVIECVSSLSACLEEHYPLDELPRRGRKRSIPTTADLNKVKKQLGGERRKSTQLRQEAQEALPAKVQGRLSHIWLVRAGLSNPSIKTRTLREFIRDFSIDETEQISSTWIGEVRNTFAEILRQFNQDELSEFCSACDTVFVSHVHDEALMRVRSFDGDRGSRLRRGRYSKILNHVVHASNGAEVVELLCELQALGRKDAQSVATGLIRVIRRVLDAWAERSAGPSGQSRRLVHIVIGDAVQTNDKAARHLYSHMRPKAGQHNVSYLMVVIKCASHQSNLVVMVAICGSVLAKPSQNCPVAGACVRLFKYLIPAYDEEFANALWTYVEKDLDISETPPSADALAHFAAMRELYGEGVLPTEITSWLNCGLGKFQHWCAAGADLATVRREVFLALQKTILVLEEKPVVTRFWLFTRCVWILLMTQLLGLDVTKIFKVTRVRPQKENIQRLSRFLDFMRTSAADGSLRRIGLCLQLTMHATSITAQKSSRSSGKPPTILRLARGEVQEKTSADLCRIVTLLDRDPHLDVDATLRSLMLTEGHIIMRFEIYNKYPYRLWRLTRTFNEDGHVLACREFLEEDESALDACYSLCIRREAASKGARQAQLDYLRSEPVQREIVDFIWAASATSLDVERKHNRDKQYEQKKVLGVAAASRNSLIQAYRIRRRAVVTQNLVLRRAASSHKYTNARALAIQERPDLFSRGRGKLWWEPEVSPEDQQKLTSVGDEAALKAYTHEHWERLSQKALAMRAAAKQKAPRASTVMPFTNREWLDWLGANDFYAFLCKARERMPARGRRLLPLAEDMPAHARVQPTAAVNLFADLARLVLDNGSGFYCVDRQTTQEDAHMQHVLVIFAVVLSGDVWAASLQRTAHREYTFDFHCPMKAQMRPIADLLKDRGIAGPGAIGKLCKLDVSLRGLEEGRATWKIDHAILAKRKPSSSKEPAKAPGGEPEEASDLSDSDFDSVHSDPEQEIELRAEEGEVDNAEDVVDEEFEQEIGLLERAAPGTHIVWNNGYFSLTNNKNYDNAVLNVLPTWAKDTEMGSNILSRRFRILRFDEQEAHPIVTYIVLRAWMLWRFEQNNFSARTRFRRQWLALQTERLQGDIRSLGVAGGGTGKSEADSFIKQWCPRALEL